MGLESAEDRKNVEAVESSSGGSIGEAHVENDATVWDEKSTARLLRKLDWNIIPFMSLVYLCASRCLC